MVIRAGIGLVLGGGMLFFLAVLTGAAVVIMNARRK